MVKILRWVVMIAGILAVLMGLLAWLGGSDFMSFAEFAIFGVILFATGRQLGKPKPAGQASDSDNDWGSALDRD